MNFGIVNCKFESQAIKSHFDQWLKPFWQTCTPGLCFEVYHQGHKIMEYQGGQHYPFYDLASLTKVLFTVPGMMSAMHRSLWNFETKVKAVLNWWPDHETKITDLLTHTSGLVWWKPFYLELVNNPKVQLRWFDLQQEIIGTIKHNHNYDIKIDNLGTPEKPKAVYSDVGFLVLAFLLEKLWSKQLKEIWLETKNEWAPQSQLHWRPSGLFKPENLKEQRGGAPMESPVVLTQTNVNQKTPIEISHSAPTEQSHYAPTEQCPWRGKRLQGEVHDENAWSLGGLSSHAGLFGGCADVAAVFMKIREIYFNLGDPMHGVVRQFCKRQISPEQGDWALGFMVPTPGQSSSGKFFSTESIGHTGFTGTSVWWDPVNDFCVILLSNRVYLGREHREFAKLRPLLHDEIRSYFVQRMD